MRVAPFQKQRMETTQENNELILEAKTEHWHQQHWENHDVCQVDRRRECSNTVLATTRERRKFCAANEQCHIVQRKYTLVFHRSGTHCHLSRAKEVSTVRWVRQNKCRTYATGHLERIIRPTPTIQGQQENKWQYPRKGRNYFQLQHLPGCVRHRLSSQSLEWQAHGHSQGINDRVSSKQIRNIWMRLQISFSHLRRKHERIDGDEEQSPWGEPHLEKYSRNDCEAIISQPQRNVIQ